jgi:hypothetical protein
MKYLLIHSRMMRSFGSSAGYTGAPSRKYGNCPSSTYPMTAFLLRMVWLDSLMYSWNLRMKRLCHGFCEHTSTSVGIIVLCLEKL